MLKCILPTLALFCLLDFVWIGHLGKSFYLDNLGSLLILDGTSLSARLIPAIIVYVLFAILIWFIVLPLSNNEPSFSFFYGALLGFVVYGIYDMTNLAVLKDWTYFIAIIDWLWGTFLCAVTSFCCAYLKQKFSI